MQTGDLSQFLSGISEYVPIARHLGASNGPRLELADSLTVYIVNTRFTLGNGLLPLTTPFSLSWSWYFHFWLRSWPVKLSTPPQCVHFLQVRLVAGQRDEPIQFHSEESRPLAIHDPEVLWMTLTIENRFSLVLESHAKGRFGRAALLQTKLCFWARANKADSIPSRWGASYGCVKDHLPQ